jgi:uncharacterized protein DUF2637
MTGSWWHLARGRGARWGVVVLWVLGAVLSYSALRDLAVMLGFPEALADLFPLVIDVAVWVGSMNALEARERGRRLIERYAWVLVAGYSLATVAGNALVASTEAVDPRLVRALGDGWAHAVSGIAHAAPAVTMILFAHLAGLLMGGRPDTGGVIAAAAVESEAAPASASAALLPTWPAVDEATTGHHRGQDMTAGTTEPRPAGDRDMSTDMTASEARQAVARLVRRGRASGREVTALDVQRVTGRGARQARRLLTAALADVDGIGRPRVVGGEAMTVHAAGHAAELSMTTTEEANHGK